MKTNRYLWMLAAIIILCGNMVLTSCSDSDDSAVSNDPGPLAATLNGMWYNIYDATGTALPEDGDGNAVSYDAVIDIYSFDENGSGYFHRCFFGDDELIPKLVQGKVGYGDFSYSSKADGTVNMALKNNRNQSYPQTWSATYAAGTITAKGVDGRELKMEKAENEIKAALSAILKKNASSSSTSKYNIEQYKPKGVDNSKWMNTLDDNRLVADLSLPGSHDACTGEGWYSELLAPIYEIMAKCNDLTIREQLKIGMRVFDLRPELLEGLLDSELRCAHGIAYTKMLVADFFRTLQTFLSENPSEFCILTVDLSATDDMETWGEEFTSLLNDPEFEGLFAEFNARLTVGEMRGRVLILSRKEYAEAPIGGYCYGWVYDLELEKQQKGYILAADGSKTPLWVQDYWGQPTRDGKDEAVVRMLEAAAARDMTVAQPAWVINFPSAYFTLPLSDSYRENATFANVVTADWLDSHDGSVGIIYMDFGGMDNSISCSGDYLFKTAGMRLVTAVINQNAVTP